MSQIATAALVAGYIVTIAGGLALAVRLLKKVKILTEKIKDIAEGQQCQLRNDITDIYYKHNEEERPTLREYERKNLDDLYDGYKALGGNHYVDDIYHAMRDWRVVT